MHCKTGNDLPSIYFFMALFLASSCDSRSNAAGLTDVRHSSDVSDLAVDAGITTDIAVDAGTTTGCRQFERLGKDVLIASEAYAPAMVWNEKGYGVVYHQGLDDIKFVQLDASGNVIGQVLTLCCGGMSALVFNGEYYGLAWGGAEGVYFVRINDSGAKEGELRQISAKGEAPSLAWNGDSYGIVWRETAGEPPQATLFYSALDPSGAVRGESVLIGKGRATFPSHKIEWTGNDYSVTWPGEEISSKVVYMAARFDTDGKDIGGSIQLESAPIVWNGAGYGYLSYTIQDGNLWFKRVDTSGNRIGSDLLLVEDTPYVISNLSWNGDVYGLIRDIHETDFAFIPIDRSGKEVGLPIQVSDYSSDPSFDRGGGEYFPPVWNGSGYAFVWTDNRVTGHATPQDVYFSQAVCRDAH